MSIVDALRASIAFASVPAYRRQPKKNILMQGATSQSFFRKH